MPVAQYRNCLGLDSREDTDDRDRFVLEDGDNIYIGANGDISSRPVLRKRARLAASAVGLYVTGGRLRTCYTGSTPTGIGTLVTYDLLQGGATPTELLAAEFFEFSAEFGPQPVLLVRTAVGNQLHWIRPPGDTYVTVPFTLGDDIIRMANKIIAPDPLTGKFHYCSSRLGPIAWSAEQDPTVTGDAGFESAVQFSSGSRQIAGFGTLRNLMVCLYADSVQLWVMDELAANILHQQTLGPGSAYPGSAVNVRGDAVFLSGNTFINLGTNTIVGEARAANLGDRIRSFITIPAGVTPKAVWWDAKSMMLCAVGSTIYAWSNFPGDGSGLKPVNAWGKWTLPVEVDDIVELDGVIYIRSGRDVYDFVDGSRDEGATEDLAWFFRPRQLAFDRYAGQRKRFRYLVCRQTGLATWTPVIDDALQTRMAVTVDGSAAAQRRKMGGRGHRVGFEVRGSGEYHFLGATIEAEL